MKASQRIARLERTPAASGGCPSCPPCGFRYLDSDDDPNPVDPPTCPACGRPVAVVVVFAYDDAYPSEDQS